MNLALRAQVIGYFVFGFTLHRYIAYWLHNRNAQLYAYMRFSRNKFYIVGHGIVDACAMEFCGCSCCIEFDLFVIFAKIHSFLLQSICLFVIECTELLQYPVRRFDARDTLISLYAYIQILVLSSMCILGALYQIDLLVYAKARNAQQAEK